MIPLSLGVLSLMMLSRRLRRIPPAVLVAISSLWWLGLVLEYPPHGFNFDIYRHNARLTLAGLPEFGRAPSPEDGSYGTSPRHPRYLDYTGAQHLVYVALSRIDASPLRFGVADVGFRLWSVLCVGLVVWIVGRWTAAMAGGHAGSAIWPAALVTFHPAFGLFMVVLSWEDKLSFLLLPLSVALLLSRGRPGPAAFATGVTIGLNGLLIPFVPVLLIWEARQGWRALCRGAGMLAAGTGLTLLPFFPGALSGWHHRAERMAASQPGWFSIFGLLPAHTYTPTVYAGTFCLAVVVLVAAFWVKRISILDALVAGVGMVLVLAPYSSPQGILPFVALVGILSPGMRLRDWLALAAMLLVYLFLAEPLDPRTIQPVHIAVFHLPVLWSLGVYVSKRVVQERHCSETVLPTLKSGGVGPGAGPSHPGDSPVGSPQNRVRANEW